MAKVKKDCDAGRRTLSSLPVGTLVVIQDRNTKRWTRRGTIVQKKKQRHTYVVETNGRSLLRNRKFLRPCLNQDIDYKAEQPEEPSECIMPEQAEQPLRRSKRHCVRKAKKVRFGKATYI